MRFARTCYACASLILSPSFGSLPVTQATAAAAVGIPLPTGTPSPSAAASTADPLSDIIAMLRPRDCLAAGLDAGGDEWAIRFERHAGMKCNAVVTGGCDLEVEGLDGTLRLEAGDCFILPRGRPFVIRATGRTGRGTDAAEGGTSAEEIYAPVSHGGTAVYGRGGDFFMSGARFLVSGPAAGVLLDTLPPAMVVRAGSRSEVMRWTVNRIARELRDPRPGGALLIDQLSHVLLIEVMRQHLSACASETIGWMAALADPAIARAIEAMHDEPARAWTVEELAARAATSRTTFAVRFRHVAGLAPMAYLTRWRMLLAADRLTRTTDPVARIAGDVGYTSESAFAHAFKREMGCSPRRFARDGTNTGRSEGGVP